MNAHPTYDKVIIEKIVAEKDQKKNTIYMPDKPGVDNFIKAKVIKCGPGRYSPEGKRMNMTVSVDDIVLVGKHSGQEIEIEDKMYLLISEPEVLVVF